MRHAGGWLILLLMLTGLLHVPASADTVFLTNGEKIEGAATDAGEDWVILTYDGREVRVPKARVLDLVRKPDLNEFHQRRRALEQHPSADGHFKLGLWAREQKLEPEARAQFQRAWELDPSHTEAAKVLGKAPGEKPTPQAEPPRAGAAGVNITTAPLTGPAGIARIKALEEKLKALPNGPAELTQSAQLPPFVQETIEQPEVFVEAFKPVHKHGRVHDPLQRMKLAFLLGLSGDRRALQPLLEACLDPREDPRVRYAASKGLRLQDEPSALRKLVDVAVDGRKPWKPTRLLASDALRWYGDKEVIERLLQEVAFELAAGNPLDPKNQPRGVAAGFGADQGMGMLPSAPPHQHQTVIYPALSALKQVTGMQFRTGELDFKTWRAWWAQNHATFQFPE